MRCMGTVQGGSETDQLYASTLAGLRRPAIRVSCFLGGYFFEVETPGCSLQSSV